MNFIQNEDVNLNETCIDTQGCFKANHSNVMDVFGRMTSNLHETFHTSYKHYNNKFNELITSKITHKHLKLHMRNIGDLVVEHLGRPLTFHF